LNIIFNFTADYSALDENSNIFDLSNCKDQDVNLAVDLYHIGCGVELTLKKSYLIIGGSYSAGNTVFEKPIDVFTGVEDFNETVKPASLEVSRWRFIIEIDIPISGNKIKIIN